MRCPSGPAVIPWPSVMCLCVLIGCTGASNSEPLPSETADVTSQMSDVRPDSADLDPHTDGAVAQAEIGRTRIDGAAIEDMGSSNEDAGISTKPLPCGEYAPCLPPLVCVLPPGRCLDDGAARFCAPPGQIGGCCTSTFDCPAPHTTCDETTRTCISVHDPVAIDCGLWPRCTGRQLCWSVDNPCEIGYSGICGPEKELGECCDVGWGGCSENLRCDQVAEVCVPKSKVGGWCEWNGHCVGKLICISGACAQVSGTGGPCDDKYDCTYGLLCIKGHCGPKSDVGGPCESTADCKLFLGCVGGVCVAPSDIGGPCDDDAYFNCQSGLVCWQGLCAGPHMIGAFCEGQADCDEGLLCVWAVDLDILAPITINGRCQAPAAAGEPCLSEQVCPSGAVCKVGMCEWAQIGSECSADEHCPAGAKCKLKLEQSSTSCSDEFTCKYSYMTFEHGVCGKGGSESWCDHATMDQGEYQCTGQAYGLWWVEPVACGVCIADSP